ncbi:tyrosine-type recombinase/integrase [Allohahella sp. A8]|uniref:tyrosine-type recombinase/integrase n=1 Tax=Allohahella sp. A8 TaxID=3141461 RepID=UPI003A809B1C
MQSASNGGVRGAESSAEVFANRVQINWGHLIERRPITLQVQSDLPPYLLLPEVHQLLDVALTPKDYLLVRLLWQTGARISEAVAVTVGQLTLTDEWGSGVLLDRLKSRGRPKKLQRDVIRKRWVPITDMTLVRELQRYINGHDLKPGDRLLPHTRQWGCKRISLLSEKARLPISVHPHTLRHSFACNAVLHGEPLTVIRDWLGHASLEQTEIYTRVLATETNHLMRYMSF